MPPSRLTPADEAEARRRYTSDPNLSVDALAADYGVARSSMLRVLGDLTRAPGARPKTTTSTETMIRMRDAGMSLEQIGKQVGLSKSGVFRRIQAHERGAGQ